MQQAEAEGRLTPEELAVVGKAGKITNSAAAASRPRSDWEFYSIEIEERMRLRDVIVNGPTAKKVLDMKRAVR